MTVIPRFAANASAEDIAQALQTVGCVIIENLAPVELVDQIGAALAAVDLLVDALEHFFDRKRVNNYALASVAEV